MPSRCPNAELILDRLEVQLIKSAKPALRRLQRAARGKSDFRNDAEIKACVALAKAAGDLVYVRRYASGIQRRSAYAV